MLGTQMSIEKNLFHFFQLLTSRKINKKLFKPVQKALRVGTVTDAKVYVCNIVLATYFSPWSLQLVNVAPRLKYKKS